LLYWEVLKAVMAGYAEIFIHILVVLCVHFLGRVILMKKNNDF